MKDGCDIVVRVEHLPTTVRREAAFWCLEQFDQTDVDLWTPLTVKVTEGRNLCNEIMSVAAFRFRNQKDANWFVMRWVS